MSALVEVQKATAADQAPLSHERQNLPGSKRISRKFLFRDPNPRDHPIGDLCKRADLERAGCTVDLLAPRQQIEMAFAAKSPFP